MTKPLSKRPLGGNLPPTPFLGGDDFASTSNPLEGILPILPDKVCETPQTHLPQPGSFIKPLKAKPSETKDLIGNLFPSQDVSVIFGHPGAGKSLLCQRLACDLSIGESLLDGYARLRQAYKVLYFHGEHAIEQFADRVFRFEWKHDSERLHVVDAIETAANGLPLSLSDIEGKKRIEHFIETDAPDVVFFDSLISFNDKDENKADNIKSIFAFLQMLARKQNIAIIVVHHSRKPPVGFKDNQLSQYDLAGSGAISRLSSIVISVEKRESVRKRDYFTVRVTKSNIEKPRGFRFSIVKFVSQDKDILKLIFHFSGREKLHKREEILDAIEENFSSITFSLREVIGLCFEFASEDHIRKTVNQLVIEGKLEATGTTRDRRFRLKDSAWLDQM